MIPTRLAKLPNSTGFLISIASGKWYLGESLPGDVSSFTDAMWVYGQYHICVVQLTDGHYHVYQSKDNGYSWNDVLDFGSEKYGCMICPNYGRAIICTSAGWWASDNSGTSWSKISTQAPGCFCVKEITSDILVAMDGSYVWRSINGGVSWSKANGAYMTDEIVQNWNTPLIAQTIHPAIDGTYYDLIVGIKNNLYYSMDGGQHFARVPAGNAWYSRESGRTLTSDIITDIEMTHIDGNGLPWWVIQVSMPNGVLRHYHVRRLLWNRVGGQWTLMFSMRPVFDAVQSQSDSLTSHEETVPGTSNISMSVAFCGKTLQNQPLLKISTDGGYKWVDQDILNAQIYTGPDLAQLSNVNNPFTEDVYLSASFQHGVCHNGWQLLGSRYRRFQSLDADILFRERVFNLGYPGGFTSILSQVKSFGADYITQKILTKSAPLDLVSKKAMLSAFVGKYISRDTFDSSVDDDLVVVTRRYLGSDHDMIAQKAFNVQLGHRAYVRGTLEHGTGSNIVLAQTHFPEIYVEMERGFPQQWDIPSLGRESKLSYKRGVMDTTRTEEE